MQRRTEKIVPIGILGFLIALLFAFMLRFENKTELINVPLSPYPDKITLKDLMSGEYQKKFGKWMTDNFYGHTKIVKSHNQIEYSVFKEGVWDGLLGQQGYLYAKGQTQVYTGGGYRWKENSQEAAYDDYAQKVYKLQTELKKKGKDFVYLLNPMKAEIYPEYLPWNEKIVEQCYANKGITETKMLLKSFNKYGVNYYDSTEDLKKMKQESDFEIFAKTGHHWTLSAAANEINSVFRNIQSLTPEMDYPLVEIKGTKDELFTTDKDLLLTLNIFRGKSSKEYLTPIKQYKNKSNQSVYIYGTSFGWELYYALFQSEGDRAFKRLVYQEYFTRLNEIDKNGEHNYAYSEENVPIDLNIMNNIRDSDLLIMEQQGLLGIPQPHLKFVDYVNKNIKHLYYTPGDNVIFYSQDAAGASFDNFWQIEEAGRWTRGDECTVHLYGQDFAKLGADLSIHLSAKSYGVNRNVEILFNGKSLGRITLTQEPQEYVLAVPFDFVKDKKNSVKFCLDGRTYSPQDLGQGNDTRNLGMWFSNLTINIAG